MRLANRRTNRSACLEHFSSSIDKLSFKKTACLTTRFCLEIPMEIGQFETKNKVQDIIALTIEKEVAKVGDILKNILGCSPSVYKTDNKTDDRGPFETITF